MNTEQLNRIRESGKSLGEITKKFDLSQKYFEVIKELSNETRDELLKKDFFNKLFNQNETL